MTDVGKLDVRALVDLPAPWRIRFKLRAGTVTIDGTSAGHLEPKGWNRDETVSVLMAALVGRIAGTSAARIERWAADRAKNGARKPLTWIEVSDLSGTWQDWWHLVGGARDPRVDVWWFRGDQVIRPTVGEAARILRAEIVGAWAGDEAKVSAPPKARKSRKG